MLQKLSFLSPGGLRCAALAAVLTVGVALSATAQVESVGLRLGGGQLLCGEVSARWPMDANRVEAGLGWSRFGYHSDMGLGATYQWHGQWHNGFGWYAGFGLHAAWQTWQSGHGDRNVAVAAMLQAGIEYSLPSSPISFTLDVRPRLYLVPDNQLLLGDVALGVRYRL